MYLRAFHSQSHGTIKFSSNSLAPGRNPFISTLTWYYFQYWYCFQYWTKWNFDFFVDFDFADFVSALLEVKEEKH